MGSKKPNELGLHDMSGNVWERCLSWHAPGYYSKSRPVDPGGSVTDLDRPFHKTLVQFRVRRGGDWRSGASRFRVVPFIGWSGTVVASLGFRVVLAPAIPSRAAHRSQAAHQAP